jgi:hypothetical protein
MVHAAHLASRLGGRRNLEVESSDGRCDRHWQSADLRLEKSTSGPILLCVPPADGIQDYSFDAEPPHGIVLPVITPIAAHAIITRNPQDYWGDGKPLRGVRIHARENSIVSELKEPPQDLKAGIAGPYPWPWPWQTEGVHLTEGSEPFPTGAPGYLAGMALRVYHTGDMITKDYRLDRFNIELSRETERIVRAWIG